MPALVALADVRRTPAQLRVRVLVEVVGATVVVACCIAAVSALASLWPPLAGWSGALVALTFLGLPIVMGSKLGLVGDPLGIGRAALRPAVALAIVVTLLIAGPFLLGFDAVQVQMSARTRWAGPGLPSYGLEMQQPAGSTQGVVALVERGVGLAVHNGLDRAILLRPACAGGGPGVACRPRSVAAGNRDMLSPREAQRTVILAGHGGPLQAPVVAGGQALDEGVVALERGWSWLFWLLLTQVVVVGLPEEAFFRGYVLGRLLAAFPARRLVLGAPFGLAHVLSALLFAAIHLVSTPSAHRLLVFFPGLLFAWLASKARTTVAPTVHHALANTMMRLAGRFYG
jgi:hypothetical protein